MRCAHGVDLHSSEPCVKCEGEVDEELEEIFEENGESLEKTLRGEKCPVCGGLYFNLRFHFEIRYKKYRSGEPTEQALLHREAFERTFPKVASHSKIRKFERFIEQAKKSTGLSWELN